MLEVGTIMAVGVPVRWARGGPIDVLPLLAAVVTAVLAGPSAGPAGLPRASRVRTPA
jgi:hypothetical protein